MPSLTSKRKCPDCGVKPGQNHKDGCDVEQCPRCGLQAISCDCIYEINGIDPKTMQFLHPDVYINGPTWEMSERWDALYPESAKLPWTGEWPGTIECKEYGFWRYIAADNFGWKTCSADHPNARPDLCRLISECVWNPELKRFVLPEKGNHAAAD